MKRLWVVGIAAVLAGCGSIQPFVPDTARLPPGALGSGGDPDVAAVNQAQWAFADAARTYGRPIEAARAAASLDYLAGEIYTSPRWAYIDPLTKNQLLQGRQELRTALGIAPGTPSQQVVDRLATVGNALAANDQPAALNALSAPAFTAGPQQTLATLSNMPYLQTANVATSHLGNELFQNDNDNRF